MKSRRILLQSEADFLLTLAKHRLDDSVHSYPDLGGRLSIPPTQPCLTS